MTPGYEAFEFEGRWTPDADQFEAVLPALLRSTQRPWLIRAAVVSEPLAEAVLDAAAGLVDADLAGRSAGLMAARALCGRRLAPEIGKRLFGAGWVGTRDPNATRRTMAQQGLRFVVEALGVSAARPYLEAALDVPELQTLAYGALAAEEPEVILPHLSDLLTRNPGLAGDVATRFALVHTDHCHAACRALADLPDETRQEFAKALEYQLGRILEIRRWVECRQILRGE